MSCKQQIEFKKNKSRSQIIYGSRVSIQQKKVILNENFNIGELQNRFKVMLEIVKTPAKKLFQP